MESVNLFKFKCLDLIYEQNKSLNLLLSNLLLHKVTDHNYSIYDNCFGLGGIFDSIAEYNNKDSKVLYYGQEINTTLFEYYKSKNNDDNYFLQNTDSIANNSFSDLKFDYLINNPPLGIRFPKDHIEYYLENNKNVIEDITKGEYLFLIDLINKSKEHSRIVSIVTGNFLDSQFKETSTLRKYLIQNDILESVVRCPEGALNETSIPFYILVIDRNKDKTLKNKIQFFNSEKYFKENEETEIENKISEEIGVMIDESGPHLNTLSTSMYSIKKRFDVNKISSFLDDYLLFKNSEHKMIIEIDENLDSLGFQFRFQKRDIQNNIKTGELLSFSSIVDEMRIINLSPLKKIKKNNEIEDFLLKYKDIQNSNKNYVFFPTIPGPNTRVRNGSLLDLEKYKYLSVKLKDGIDSKYVTDLYNTKLGKDFIKCVTRGAYMPSLTLSSIKEMPYIENKHSDIEEKNKVTKLIQKLSQYEEEGRGNQNDVFNLLNEVNNFFPEFNIMSLIKGGEGNRVEFKSTFSKPLGTPSKDFSIKELRNKLETACLKTICGFLNADGGTLLIGVGDNGEIIGIEFDSHKNKDDHNLDLSQKIEGRIGLSYIRYIDIKYYDIDDKTICEVKCKTLRGTGTDIAPLKEKKSTPSSSWKYYLRAQAKTIPLEGKDLADHQKFLTIENMRDNN